MAVHFNLAKDDEGDVAMQETKKEEEQEDAEEAKLRLAVLDSAIAALEPLELDPEIGVIVGRKKAERMQLVENLRAAKPLAVRYRRALERREKLTKR